MGLNSVVKLWATVGWPWRQSRSLWHTDISDQHEQSVIAEAPEEARDSSHHNGKEESKLNQGADGQGYHQSHNEPYQGLIVMPGRFPPEIWCMIIVHAASPVDVGSGDSSKYITNKVSMNSLLNLASTSRFYRQLVLTYWAHTVHLLERDDPKEFVALGVANAFDLLPLVRRLVCTTAYQVYRAPKNAFAGFIFVEELVLSCHLDINFGEGGLGQQQHPHDHAGPQATHGQDNNPGTNAQGNLNDDDDQHLNNIQPVRMSYRRLRVKFPDTLRTLRIYDSHVPDIYFIQQVAEQCPLIQSLTLARCTIFARRECEFWKRLPRTETDAYFSNQGIPAYTSAIGKELKQISLLRELNIGIYLTNHAAIDIHLEQHASGIL